MNKIHKSLVLIGFVIFSSMVIFSTGIQGQTDKIDVKPVVRVSNLQEYSGVNYADVVNSRDINLNSFTVSIWFNSNIDTKENERYLISKGIKDNVKHRDNLNYILFLTKNGQISGGFETSTGDIYRITSSKSYNDGNWHHAVLTFREASNNLKLYIDGIEVAGRITNPGVKPDTSGDEPIRIAATNNLNPDGEPIGGFIGMLGNVNIWDIAATQAQVLSLFNTGNGGDGDGNGGDGDGNGGDGDGNGGDGDGNGGDGDGNGGDGDGNGGDGDGNGGDGDGNGGDGDGNGEN